MLTTSNKTSPSLRTPIRAVLLAMIVGAIVWYGVGNKSSETDPQVIQTRGLVETSVKECNDAAKNLYASLRAIDLQACEYNNGNAAKSTLIDAINKAYSFPLTMTTTSTSSGTLQKLYPRTITAANAEEVLTKTEAPIVSCASGTDTYLGVSPQQQTCSTSLVFKVQYNFQGEVNDGGVKKAASFSGVYEVTAKKVGGVYKAGAIAMSSAPGKKKAVSTPQIRTSDDLLFQTSILPLDQLNPDVLKYWCEQTKAYLKSGLDCASQSTLIQQFQDVLAFYNLPSQKVSRWRGTQPIKAYIGEESLPPSQFKIVNSDQLKMYYQIWEQKPVVVGSPRNTPVVMLGGWSSVKEDWQDSARYWSATKTGTRRTMMTVDVRGAGQTGLGPTPGDYTASQIAQDVSDLIQQVFPGEKVFLIGGALGGKIALQMAVDHPQLFKAVIPCATVAGGDLTVYGPLRQKFIDITVNNKRESEFQAYAEALYSPTFVSNNLVQAYELLQRGSKYNRPHDGTMRQRGIAETFDLTSELDRISLPILCMHGTDDQIDLPESSQNLCAAIGTNAKYEPLTDEGHAFWQMDPKEFVDDAEVFFSDRGL